MESAEAQWRDGARLDMPMKLMELQLRLASGEEEEGCQRVSMQRCTRCGNGGGDSG